LGPAFAEYEESLNVNGFTPTYVLASLEDEFALTPELVNKTFALQPDLIFLANPANPTGRLVPPEVLTSLFERAQKAGIKVILDEAFIGFTFGKSSQGLTLTHPGLIVLRSLTKILAIPGLRLAYLAAHPDLIQRLREHAEPWPINFMALEAGIYSLPQKDYLEATPRVTEKLRNMLISRLSPFVTFIPSDTNFVLAKVRDKEKLIAHLYQKGILVRDCANFAGIGPDFLRLAVRPEPEQIDLLEAFEEFYA
jgi:threonine-phosphate decarboxylase